ncbi:Fibronectin type III domain [Sphingobacterium spiritivorum]|uniref:Fibronectin type III domain n=1 Tax=Sphingobacterium spiritivorum TaxID=258 RepID=A0A380CBM8_SPHSI|nr:DUF5123 domain-containing protein [Sphingobacterium spiritivorum]SUJ17098.1 Fibronectin type III domain [Sphingobacterium spiritivorum]
MKVHLKKYTIYGLLGISLSLSGCSKDALDVIKTLDTDQSFSPVGLTAILDGKTSIVLTWTKAINAEAYTVELSESANFEGTPFKTIENIKISELPYTISGLSGDTEYHIRVKGTMTGKEDSKWVMTTLKTASEQIFNPVDLSTITAKSVVLSWPAAAAVTSISLSPGNIQRTLTADEIAKGSALIEGLIPETSYSAILLNGTKTRGTAIFKTGIDIGDAILVTSVAELTAGIASAKGGETFALTGGNYDFVGATGVSLALSKPVAIVAARVSEKPVLNNVGFTLSAGAALKFQNVIVDGGNNLNNAITVGNGVYGEIIIEGSEIRNYKAGVIIMNTSGTSSSTVAALKINNNIFRNYGNSGEFIDFRTGFPLSISFTNNTVYGIADREFIRIDAAGTNVYPAGGVGISVSNNTLVGLANASSRRFFYVRIPAANHSISFTKNIVTGTVGLLANQSQTNITTLSGNNYFNATSLQVTASGTVKVDANGTSLDPGFANAANGDFTISNNTLKGNGIGDPRWIR